jgi:hypothetical protein
VCVCLYIYIYRYIHTNACMYIHTYLYADDSGEISPRTAAETAADTGRDAGETSCPASFACADEDNACACMPPGNMPAEPEASSSPKSSCQWRLFVMFVCVCVCVSECVSECVCMYVLLHSMCRMRACGLQRKGRQQGLGFRV